MELAHHCKDVEPFSHGLNFFAYRMVARGHLVRERMFMAGLEQEVILSWSEWLGQDWDSKSLSHDVVVTGWD